VNALTAALTSLPLEAPAGPQLVLYRGQSFTGDASYTPGDEVVWHAFSSTTTNRHVAEAFAGSGYVFEIYGVTPEVCASVSKFSVYPSEEEILLNRGTKFVVESATSSNPRVIRLRVVPGNGVSPNPQPTPGPTPGPHPTPAPHPVPAPYVPSPSPSVGHSGPCLLCQFEYCIGSNQFQSCNATNALNMLSDASFIDLVMTKTRNQFSTRVPYHFQSSSNRVHAPNNPRRRPWLYLASRNNLPEVVRRLLSLGANPLDVIDVGSTALHAAAFYGRTDCVRVLLENIPATTRSTLVQMKNMLSGSGATAADEARDSNIRAMIRAYM
jgi:hypothetical protein